MLKITRHEIRKIIREMHHQGYDAREDESLAALYGPAKDHEQDYKDRRDDAEYEERGPEEVHVHHHYHQGYDDREDEKLAAEHGGEHDHEQDYKDRRDDAEYEEKKHEAFKRKLKRIIRGSILREQTQMSLPMHGSEELYGDGGDDYYAAVRTPEAVEALKAAGFMANGEIEDASQGLGVFSHGMYTPQNQEELERAITAALEINQALMQAHEELMAGKHKEAADEAYYAVVSPVQRKHSKTGAADTEGRESAGGWLEDQDWEWNY